MFLIFSYRVIVRRFTCGFTSPQTHPVCPTRTSFGWWGLGRYVCLNLRERYCLEASPRRVLGSLGYRWSWDRSFGNRHPLDNHQNIRQGCPTRMASIRMGKDCTAPGGNKPVAASSVVASSSEASPGAEPQERTSGPGMQLPSDQRASQAQLSRFRNKASHDGTNSGNSSSILHCQPSQQPRPIELVFSS